MEQKKKFFQRKKLLNKAAIISYLAIIFLTLALPHILPLGFELFSLVLGVLLAFLAVGMAYYANKKI